MNGNIVKTVQTAAKEVRKRARNGRPPIAPLSRVTRSRAVQVCAWLSFDSWVHTKIKMGIECTLPYIWSCICILYITASLENMACSVEVWLTFFCPDSVCHCDCIKESNIDLGISTNCHQSPTQGPRPEQIWHLTLCGWVASSMLLLLAQRMDFSLMTDDALCTKGMFFGRYLIRFCKW